MEDADSDSGFDSDGDWYHAGRDIVYGLRTDSYAVGPRRRRKREAPGGDASLFCRQVQKQDAETTTDLGANTPVNCKRLRMKMGRNGLVSLYFAVSLQA